MVSEITYRMALPETNNMEFTGKTQKDPDKMPDHLALPRCIETASQGIGSIYMGWHTIVRSEEAMSEIPQSMKRPSAHTCEQITEVISWRI
jgi:hypothetical protein